MEGHENESTLEAENQLQTKAHKKDHQGGILLPILYALLAAIGGFTLVMVIGIATTILNGPSQPVTAAVPSQAVTQPEGITQSSYQYFKEKAAEEAANLPPIQTEEPSAEPLEGLFPDSEQSAPPAPVQSTEPTPAPTRSPSTTPSGSPVQTTSPVVPSTRPVQQNPTQSGNQDENITMNGRTIYITNSGERYHYDNHCNGGTYYPGTWAEVQARNLTPCNKCVLD